MCDFLIIGNTREIRHIAADDIWYISAEGDYSTLFLTNGGSVQVIMQLGKVEEVIKKSLPNSCHNFHRVGRSLIINRLYLKGIDLSKQELVLADRRQECYVEAFAAGYAAGYSRGAKDAQTGKSLSVNSEVNHDGMRFSVSKNHLKDLLITIKQLIR